MPPLYIYESQNRPVADPDYYHWLKIDQTVHSWIFATLSRDTLVEVHDVQFSTLIWECLPVRFMSTSLARSMDLKRLLSNVSKRENQSTDKYLHDIKMIADSLVAINSPVSSQDLIHYVILDLGNNYESLVTAITHFSGNLSFDELRSKLLFQEQQVTISRATCEILARQ